MANNTNAIKFIWKIVNFSCVKGGILQSPSFNWNSSRWEVIIHLTDITKVHNYFSIELHQLQRTQLFAYCSFAFLDSQGYPLVWKEKGFTFCFSHTSQHYLDSLTIQNFVKGSEIFGSRRNEFLPNDVLTVQCRIWVDTSNLFIEHVPLVAHTQIEPLLKVTQKSFTWNIVDVLSYGGNSLERVESMTINGEPLSVKLILRYDKEWNLRISVSLFRILLKITISVLDILGKKIQLVKDEFLFEKSDQKWNLDITLTKSMLKFYRNAFLHNDTLSLHFSCTLSGNVTFNSLVDENIMDNIVLPNADAGHISETNQCTDDLENEIFNKTDHPDTVSKAIQGMYEEGFLSDFDLKVGDRHFPVHKAVLGMRSPVFRAMFTSEMKEKEDNCSVIEDVDGDTLHRMLQFIYTDKLEEDIGWEGASSLFEAADKYALETLKQRCSAVLRSGLCADSVLDVLKLADMHHDQELKSSAFEFLSQNDKEILGSERWNRFEAENKELALDTFRSLYLHLKKMIS